MLHFELVTLSGPKFRESAHEVLLPTPQGQIGIFINHAPLISVAAPGVISVRRKTGDPDDFMEHYAVSGGVIEILDNNVRVLVDEADHAEELNEAEVQKALDQAVKLKKEAKDIVSIEHAQSLVDRQATRLKVASLRRHRRKQYK